jgi:hypothetical protein
MIIPIIVGFTGIGLSTLYTDKSVFSNRILTSIIVIAILGFSFLVSFNQVRGYYTYDKNLIRIAGIIQTLTGPDDKIVTDTMGDTTLLYLSNRRGFPHTTDAIDKLKKYGLKYIVTSNYETVTELKKNRTPVFQSETVHIFPL